MKNKNLSMVIAASILLAGVLVLANGFLRGSQSVQHYFELRDNLETMELTVENLKSQNKDLRKEIHKLKTSPEYAKKVLRDKYHVTEPGERIIFFSE